MNASERSRLIKSLRLLSSPIDGECLAAGKAAHRIAEQHGGWESIITNARGATAAHLWDWRQAAVEILDSDCASPWEVDFCQSLLRKWRGACLTSKQEETLRRIHESCRRASA
jgi:hypothetical protein